MSRIVGRCFSYGPKFYSAGRHAGLPPAAESGRGDSRDHHTLKRHAAAAAAADGAGAGAGAVCHHGVLISCSD